MDERSYSAARSESLTSQKPASASGQTLSVHVRRTPPKPTSVFDSYWRFAAERQAVYLRRLAGQLPPWTDDPVISQYRFTNVYRATDRVSQYLIGKVIYGGEFEPEDLVLRVLLFKIFNKIGTWELIEEQVGQVKCAGFDVEQIDRVLSQAFADGTRIYSAAYIMPNAPKEQPGSPKHRSHLELLRSTLKGPFLRDLLGAQSMASAYRVLLSLPSIGPFLAYQYVIDLNYSPCLSFSENDFVQPGPGALSGLQKCFSTPGDYSPAQVIEWVTQRQDEEFAARELKFQDLWGRNLHLIDCQNLFCEVDKYARVVHPNVASDSGRIRIKQKFKAQDALPQPFFPPKWKVHLPMKQRAERGTSTWAKASN
jgi:hypothetical protein